MTAGNLRIISYHFIHWHSTDIAAQVKECLSFLPGANCNSSQDLQQHSWKGAWSQSLRESNDLQEPFKTRRPAPRLSLRGRYWSKTQGPVKVSQILDLPFSKAKWGFIAVHTGSLWLCLLPSPLQGFLWSVSTITHETSLKFQAGPAFISHCPLALSPFLYSVDCLGLSAARRNPSSFKGRWKEERQMCAGSCRTLSAGLGEEEAVNNPHQSFLSLPHHQSLKAAQKVKVTLEATHLQMRIDSISQLLLHNIQPHFSGI